MVIISGVPIFRIFTVKQSTSNDAHSKQLPIVINYLVLMNAFSNLCISVCDIEKYTAVALHVIKCSATLYMYI